MCLCVYVCMCVRVHGESISMFVFSSWCKSQWLKLS